MDETVDLQRRRALVRVANAVRQSGSGPARLVPRTDLVNVLQFEAQAQRALTPAVFARMAGGDRAPFDRVTIQPRVMVPTRQLDLGLTLLGHAHESPIVAGPMAPASLGAPDADLLLLRGASTAGTTVIAAGTTATRAEIRDLKTPVWAQVFATSATLADDVARAVDAGCRAVCVTMGAIETARGTREAAVNARQWQALQAAVGAARVPVIAKGVTTAAAATRAIEQGAAAIVLSNYGGLLPRSTSASIFELPAIVNVTAGKVPVLIDGSFRRGTDILKALALGASAVLVARPVAWGLAAYGAEGVQSVLELLQTELARYMAMAGKPSLAALDRSMVRIHER
jgi:isopentenyl diphosphate isomerase/L-lactate dehydrogenase-like FMN-dependent dehydrogenase